MINKPNYDEEAKKYFENEGAFNKWFLGRQNSPPEPKKKDFTKMVPVTTVSADGKSLAVKIEKRTFSKTPVFRVVVGHEIDSRWEYPEMEPKKRPARPKQISFFNRYFPAV